MCRMQQAIQWLSRATADDTIFSRKVLCGSRTTGSKEMYERMSVMQKVIQGLSRTTADGTVFARKVLCGSGTTASKDTFQRICAMQQLIQGLSRTATDRTITQNSITDDSQIVCQWCNRFCGTFLHRARTRHTTDELSLMPICVFTDTLLAMATSLETTAFLHPLSVLRAQAASIDMLCNLAYIKMLNTTGSSTVELDVQSQKMDLLDNKLRLGVPRSHYVRDKSTVLNVYIFRILYTLVA